MSNLWSINTVRKIGIASGIIIASLVFAYWSHASTVDAESQFISVFADGEERTIRTQVSTVREALDKARVVLAAHDRVEPAPDTIIVDATFRINVYRARPVAIVDGGEVRHVMSPFQSARLIAEQAGVTLYPEDTFSVERIDDILAFGSIGQRLTINRATPVSINLYGNEFTLRTHEKTLGEAIAARGILLSDEDIVRPKLSTPIAENMSVRVVHVGTETISVEEPAPYETEIIRDSNRFIGEREVVEPGTEGVRLTTYEVVLHGGKEASREVLQSVLLEEPVAEVVVEGTKVLDPSSNAAMGQQLAAQRGWTDHEWLCLYSLWRRESNWNHLASNPSSGAYGIPQSLPGHKMSSVGADWQTNPATQINWGLNYIAGRYGSPCGAWEHSELHNWY